MNDTNKLKTLSAYALRSDSPLINKGHAISSFLSAVVKHDFFGDTALKGGKYDIGADEVR